MVNAGGLVCGLVSGVSAAFGRDGDGACFVYGVVLMAEVEASPGLTTVRD